MNKHAVGLLLASLLAVTGAAHGKGKSITILAPISCAEWQEGRKVEKNVDTTSLNVKGTLQRFWLLGLITGLNSKSDKPNLLDSIDSTLIFDWMDRYCSQNQEATVFTGAEELLTQVSRRVRR